MNTTKQMLLDLGLSEKAPVQQIALTVSDEEEWNNVCFVAFEHLNTQKGGIKTQLGIVGCRKTPRNTAMRIVEKSNICRVIPYKPTIICFAKDPTDGPYTIFWQVSKWT